jgi:hypothetical protein
MKISVEELRDFLRQNPPRSIPANIRKKALKRVPAVLIIFGLFFGLFGSIFLFIFFPWRIADELRLNIHAKTASDATVTVRAETNMRENEVRVYRYEFSYTTDEGAIRPGHCFLRGGAIAEKARVMVEYLPGNPDVARIKGCRLSPFGWGGIFVVIFPLVGFGMVFFSLRSRRRLRAILSYGRFSSGKIESVDATNVRVNKQMQYKVQVSFQDDFADRTTYYYAYGDQATLAENKRTSGAPVGILYDPSNPSRILLVDELLNP